MTRARRRPPYDDYKARLGSSNVQPAGLSGKLLLRHVTSLQASASLTNRDKLILEGGFWFGIVSVPGAPRTERDT